jgi:hypothetical protein
MRPDKAKKLTARIRSKDRQEKEKQAWKKPVKLKPVGNTRIRRISRGR